MDRVKEMQNKFYCEREFPFNGLTHVCSLGILVVGFSRFVFFVLWLLSLLLFHVATTCGYGYGKGIHVFEEDQRMQANWLYRLFENCDIHMITGEFLKSFHAEISLAFYFQQIVHLQRFSCCCRTALLVIVIVFLFFIYLFIRFIVFVLVCYL